MVAVREAQTRVAGPTVGSCEQPDGERSEAGTPKYLMKRNEHITFFQLGDNAHKRTRLKLRWLI